MKPSPYLSNSKSLHYHRKMIESSCRPFVAASLLCIAAVSHSAPCVGAFRASFAPRFNSRKTCGVAAGKWHALVSHRRKTAGNMWVKSPMIQGDVNEDALSTDDEFVTEENVPPSASVPLDKASTTSTSTSGITSPRSSRQLPTNWLGEKNYILFTAVLIGLFTGINIAVFKTAVEFVREVLYGDGLNLQLISPYLWGGGDGGEEIRTLSLRLSEVLPISVIPAVGGLIVGLLLRFGGDMPPGLRDAVREGMNVSFSMTILEQSC